VCASAPCEIVLRPCRIEEGADACSSKTSGVRESMIVVDLV
jgi:hypothetical protein